MTYQTMEGVTVPVSPLPGETWLESITRSVEAAGLTAPEVAEHQQNLEQAEQLTAKAERLNLVGAVSDAVSDGAARVKDALARLLPSTESVVAVVLLVVAVGVGVYVIGKGRG